MSGQWWDDLAENAPDEIHVHTEQSGDIYIERNLPSPPPSPPSDESDSEALDEDLPAPPSPSSYHVKSSPSLISMKDRKHGVSIASPLKGQVKELGDRIAGDLPASPPSYHHYSKSSPSFPSFPSPKERKHAMSHASPRKRIVGEMPPRRRGDIKQSPSRTPISPAQRRSRSSALRLLKTKVSSRKKESSSHSLVDFNDDDDDDPPPPPPPPSFSSSSDEEEYLPSSPPKYLKQEEEEPAEVHVHTEPRGDIYIERTFHPHLKKKEDKQQLENKKKHVSVVFRNLPLGLKLEERDNRMIVDGFNPSFTRHALESHAKSPVGKIFIGDIVEKINGVRVRNKNEVARLCNTLKHEGSPLGIRVTLSRSRSVKEDEEEGKKFEPLNLERKLVKETRQQPVLLPMYRAEKEFSSSSSSSSSMKIKSPQKSNSRKLKQRPIVKKSDPLTAPIKISPSKYRKLTQDEIEESRRHFRQFRSDMARRTISAGQLWFFMDPHRSGKVKLNQFSRGLEEAGIHRSEKMVQELFCRIDTNGDGRIEWSEFNMIVGKLFSRQGKEHRHVVLPKNHKLPNLNQSPRIDSRMPKENIDKLFSKITTKTQEEKDPVEDLISINDDVDVLGKELARHAISEGQLWFFMDPHRTGKVLPKEFSRGILEAGVKRSPISLRRLFNTIDSDADGRITWPEFKSALSASIARSRPVPVSSGMKMKKKRQNKNKLPSYNQIERAVRLERLRDELRRHVVTQGQLFYFMDKNRNDLITLKEFRQGLLQSNIHYPDEDTETLFRDIDSDMDLRISWTELQNALVGGESPTFAEESLSQQVSPPAPPPTPVLSSTITPAENVTSLRIIGKSLRREKEEEEDDKNIPSISESLKRLRKTMIEHDTVVSPSKEDLVVQEQSTSVVVIPEEIRDEVISAKRRLRDAMSRKALFGITVAIKKLEALVGSNDPDVKEGRCMIELFEISEEEKELKRKSLSPSGVVPVRTMRRRTTTKELPSPVTSVSSSVRTNSSLSTIRKTKETLLKKFSSVNKKNVVPRKITTYRDAVNYVSKQAKLAPESKPRNTWTVAQEIRRRRSQQRSHPDSSGVDWSWIQRQYSEIEKHPETY